MSKIAFVFPGQGSQYTGMGKDLYDNFEIARNVFDKFDSVLGRDLSKTCFEGSEEDLKQTYNAQPAILAVSLAAYEVLKSKTNFVPDYVAGHSLGEYSALNASGVIQLEEIIKLVQKRAELMGEAPAGNMTAILGLNEEKISELVEKSSSEGVICAANYNTPEQIVISGESKAIEYANKLAEEMGAKRVIPLAVSGAFHSPLMKEVSEKFQRFVNDTNINDATISVITNVDAKQTVDKAEFSTKMVKQIHSSVYWSQTINFMLDQGVDTFIEIGPGKALSGMIKKINKKTKVFNISDVSTLEKAIDSLNVKTIV